MKKTITIFKLFSILWLAGACSTIYIVGENFDDSQVDALVIGETDKTQVLYRFGEPFKRGLINHLTVFMYTYEETEFPPNGLKVYVDSRYKSLMILFDEQNKVKYFAHNLPFTANSFEMMMIHEEKIRQQEEDDDTGTDGK